MPRGKYSRRLGERFINMDQQPYFNIGTHEGGVAHIAQQMVNAYNQQELLNEEKKREANQAAAQQAMVSAVLRRANAKPWANPGAVGSGAGASAMPASTGPNLAGASGLPAAGIVADQSGAAPGQVMPGQITGPLATAFKDVSMLQTPEAASLASKLAMMQMQRQQGVADTAAERQFKTSQADRKAAASAKTATDRLLAQQSLAAHQSAMADYYARQRSWENSVRAARSQGMPQNIIDQTVGPPPTAPVLNMPGMSQQPPQQAAPQNMPPQMSQNVPPPQALPQQMPQSAPPQRPPPRTVQEFQEQEAERKAAQQAEAATTKTVAEERAKAKLELPDILNKSQYAMDLVTKLVNHPGMPGMVGFPATVSGTAYKLFDNPVAGTPEAGFLELKEQVESQQFLEAFNALRGGGHITEAEGAKATKSRTRLGSTNLREDEYRGAAKELLDIMQKGVERAYEKAGVPMPEAAPAGPQADLEYVPGVGVQPTR